MYVILVNEDDTLYGSKKERIVQRQKLVNDLIFIVDPIYRNTHDMTKASVLLEYVLPVSRKYETVYLELCEERYNGYFLQYKLPFDVSLTAEYGEVELQLTFAYVQMDENGKTTQHVRKTTKTTINIVPISAWSDLIPDNALSALDERLLVTNAQINALADLANTINTNQVDDLVYNKREDTLHLSAKGEPIGTKIQVKDILDDGIPVIDLNSDSSNGDNSSSGNDNDCNCVDCNCEDNVVEFGYSDAPNTSTDDNVIEF